MSEYDTRSEEYTAWAASIWKENHKKNFYSDGTPKTFWKNRSDLNSFGYQHRSMPCNECGKWECDPNGVGHYRG